MALSSLALQAGAAGMSTVGSYYSSLGEKTALGFQADIDAINAKISEGRARDALARGGKEYQKSRLSTAALKSEQRTAMAENGIDLSFGTASAVLASTDMLGGNDAEQIKANAVREAWGHRLEAAGLRGSAGVNRATAKGINPGLNATGTLLTNATAVAGSYYKMKNSGSLDTSKPKKLGGVGAGGVRRGTSY